MLDLTLTPAGHLVVIEAAGPEDGIAGPEALCAALAGGRALDSAAVLFALVEHGGSGAPALPPGPAHWRRLAAMFLLERCRAPRSEPAEALAAPLELLAEWAESAPPMRGGEYLRQPALLDLWRGMDERAREQIAAHRDGMAGWLARFGTQWARVGRVCFHLAENSRDADHPFAFLATYAPRLTDGGRVQYQPLGHALQEFAGAKNRQALAQLLAPVQRAAELCPWVKALIDSGEVFHPLRWTPGEAHRLLRDAPLLEQGGLLLRLPDWWTRRAPRVRAAVSIGTARPAQFGADAMLDFKVELALDGDPLTPEERLRVLQSTDGLIFLKGRWVEADAEQIQQALQHWKRVERTAAGEGLSFLEGMRLLAGAPLEPADDDRLELLTADWSDVRSGDWLSQTLARLRQNEASAAGTQVAGLRAVLRPYQRTGIEWLRQLTELRLGACLADDMGLGKTIQVLALLMSHRRRRDSASRPSIVVLPASLLANWKAEMERFTPTLRPWFAHPSQTPPAKLDAAAATPDAALAGVDVVLTTYAMLPRLPWLAQTTWALAILDEAQAIKNPAARQTRAVKSLQANARIALTGTPVENRLGDLWSIFDFLCPGLLGSAKTFTAFVKRLEARPADRYGPLRRLVAPYILRRMKTDRSIIDDLPEKLEMQAFCGLSKRQAVLYEESVRALAAALDGQEGGIARRGTILAYILRFKQICNHPDQWLGTGEYRPADSGKLQRLGALVEEIAERQEQVLVFTQFREMTAPLASFLQGVFGRPGLVLHGGTAVRRRREMVEQFQREDGPPFMVLSLKAGGTGLNLTRASHVIHFDRWWNPAVENQATDRAFRIGQLRRVVVHKFICQGTIEERIDALIRDKTALAAGVFEDAAPRLVTEMTDAELLDLVRLDISRAAAE